MLLRKLAIQNVRSFLERQELNLEGQISIIIGPNGGGKTNLLDTAVIMLRRYLFASRYFGEANGPNNVPVLVLQDNGSLSQLQFEKHSSAPDQPQVVEVVIEITERDVESMAAIQADAEAVKAGLSKPLHTDPWAVTTGWALELMEVGSRVTYRWVDGELQPGATHAAIHFLQYLQLAELDNRARSDQRRAANQMPMIYLPVNRGANGFQSSVTLSGFNYNQQRQNTDATNSRSGSTYIPLAIGAIASRYRLLQEESNVNAKEVFLEDATMQALTEDLRTLGYDWELVTVDALSNNYDIRLTKQGTSFMVANASSGERELLTYLFAIHALNVRDALILVDEPELHLHPRWQASLLTLFEKLAKETGNQFVMATHSPTFVSPSSIQYVSRVYSEGQRSRIIRLNSTDLPNAKHLFNVINSQNNERIFFADCVLLVEGLSDRIFFEKLLDLKGRDRILRRSKTLEIVSVGGKGLFAAYRKLLDACQVQSLTIADLDYVEQVGTGAVKALFALNAGEIAKDVINNPGSMDGASLVARIDEAMANGDWGDAAATWEYIKSRRIKLKPELSEQEVETLNAFIAAKLDEGVCILSRGALEAYLPEGYRAKDVEKLIDLVNDENFPAILPEASHAELDAIVQWIFDSVAPEENGKEEVNASEAEDDAEGHPS